MLRLPRLVLAAPHSGAGKTTVALALLQARPEGAARFLALAQGKDKLHRPR